MWSLPIGCQETMRNVHKRIFLTFLRLSTHKENKVCKYNISYITRNIISTLIYLLVSPVFIHVSPSHPPPPHPFPHPPPPHPPSPPPSPRHPSPHSSHPPSLSSPHPCSPHPPSPRPHPSPHPLSLICSI